MARGVAEGPDPRFGYFAAPSGHGGRDARKIWRVLVLEDTGELLSPDAKAVIGQGLSRFLNVVDGLIGQASACSSS